MKTYILLFRGINVGGRNKLPMKALTSLLSAEGYQNVSSYIQSGNVVLSSDSKPDKSICSHIEQNFGFCPELLVLEKAEFEQAVAHNPYTAYEGKTVHFYFCAKPPAIDQAKLTAYLAYSERYHLHQQVFYLHAPDGIGRSKLVANIEACLGVPATGRNLNTVKKLETLAENAHAGQG